MADESKAQSGFWISLILRFMFITFIGGLVVGKLRMGVSNMLLYYQDVFKEAWIPSQAVVSYVKMMPFIEILIPIWLIVGVRLRWAWTFTALYIATFAFGAVVIRDMMTAFQNYFYVLLCCAGVYFSPYDRLSLDGMLKEK